MMVRSLGFVFLGWRIFLWLKGFSDKGQSENSGANLHLGRQSNVLALSKKAQNWFGKAQPGFSETSSWTVRNGWCLWAVAKSRLGYDF
jgi:hypothetical protein